jgi:RNA polymerase sigma-70 factor (ECF subfamily)
MQASEIVPDVGSAVELSDEEVVARVRAGDAALYEILMRRHNQRVYRVVRAILRDDAEAEDAMQEAYLAAYRHLDRFEGRSRFSSWLVRIAANEALDRLRRRARFVRLDPGLEHEGRPGAAPTPYGGWREDPDQMASTRELSRLLEHEIDSLPEPYRAVFVLRSIEGLDVDETAEHLAIEPNTVKSRLHRARALLRRGLDRELGAAAEETFSFGAARCDRLVAAVLARLAEPEPAGA